jgi:predicted nuclease of restriction endonuclease-like (RecB) superfamily
MRKLPRAVAETRGEWTQPKLPQPVAELPWGHNVLLLEKLDGPEDRLWYAARTKEHGWSRSVLALQIGTRVHLRQGKAVTNFRDTLPPTESDLATQALKDPYVFDFLTLGREAREKDLEQGLVDQVQKFLLELGTGFAFVGRQVHLEVGDEGFYLDLLFYHLKLRCYVVIELKAVKFQPGFVGKLNMYLSAVDDLLRHAHDKPTIGLLLCRSKNKIVVEYGLRHLKRPIGVAEWETQIIDKLPEDLKGSLPTVEEIEAELGLGKK